MSRARAVGILILAAFLTLPLAGQRPTSGGNPPHPQQKNGGPKGPPRLGAWLRAHKDMSLEQQEKALENDPDFSHRSPQIQAQLKERLRKFNGLPQQQKEKALINMEYWEKLSKEQKEQIRQAHEHMVTLSPERRVMVRKELRDLRKMTPAQRQQTFDSEQFKATFSDQEQAILRNLAEINPMTAQNGEPH